MIKMSFLKNVTLEALETFNATKVEWDPMIIAQTVILAILVLVVGNFLLSAIYLYEKFGQDPKKRTISNILISHLCIIIICYNLSGGPLMTIALAFGPLGNILIFSVLVKYPFNNFYT